MVGIVKNIRGGLVDGNRARSCGGVWPLTSVNRERVEPEHVVAVDFWHGMLLLSKTGFLSSYHNIRRGSFLSLGRREVSLHSDPGGNSQSGSVMLGMLAGLVVSDVRGRKRSSR